MLSDSQIKRLLHQIAGDATDIMFREEVRAFSRACHALERDAGLAEAQRACEPYGKVGEVIAITIGTKRATKGDTDE